MSEFGLTTQTIEKIHYVLSQFPLLDRVVLYGSRAKGSFRNGSDIDLTLIGDQLTHSDLREIENRLDDLYLPYSLSSVFWIKPRICDKAFLKFEKRWSQRISCEFCSCIKLCSKY